MAVEITHPELDLNLRHVDEFNTDLSDRIRMLFGEERAEEMLAWMEEVRFLFTQIEPETHRAFSQVESQLVFPYQTLVTSASNLSSGVLNGRTRANSVLTTNSESVKQFDWRKPKRSVRIVSSPGDGVEPMQFFMNPDFNAPAFKQDSTGTWIQRTGLMMPYGKGSDLQLVFFEYDAADSYKPKPKQMGIGTTIYLEQRLPGDE